MDQISRWLDVLSSEVYYRLTEEYEEYHRWPKTITVSHLVDPIFFFNFFFKKNLHQMQLSHRSAQGVPQSRSCPLPNWNKIKSPDAIADLALHLVDLCQNFLP